MGDRDLKYRILGDNMLGRAVGGAVGQLGKLSKAGLHAAGSMVSGMSRILKRGLQVGFAGTIAGAIWSVRDSMAVGEMESKFDAVFKSLKDSARDWSKDFAASTKRSEYDVRGWMSSIQDTLVPMGVARDEASKLSREITALGVDLGSFNDMDAGEAVERIIGALVGNHENVRKFGVVITEAAMKQKALEMGLVKANAPLSEQAKLLVRLRMIQDGTTDAQGDAVKTAGSLANSWKGLLAVFKTFRVEVGNQIVEGLGLANVFGAMERGLGGFIAKMKESGIVQEWAEKVKGLLVDIAAIGKAMATPGKRGDVMGAVGKVLMEAFKSGASSAVSVLLRAMPILGKILGEGAKAAFKPDSSRIHAAMGWLGGGADPNGRKAASLRNVLDNDPSGYLDLEKEFRKLIEAKDIKGAKRFARGLGKIGVDPDKLLAGGYRPGADMAGMLGGSTGGLQGAIENLRNVVAVEREQIQNALGGGGGKSKWEDVDQTSLDSLRKHFRDIGDPRSDESLIENYLKKAEEPAARKRDGLRGWADGDTTGKGGIWGSMSDRFAGTRAENQNMQALSGWGGGGGGLGAGQKRRGVDMGEVFTRMHGQGGGKAPEEQQVDILKRIDDKLGDIKDKKGGMVQ